MFRGPLAGRCRPSRLVTFVYLWTVVGISAVTFGGPERVLQEFPIEIHVGQEAEGAGGRVLLDRPFALEAGFGFVGGERRTKARGQALGETSSRPLVWREGIDKYLIRLPRGEYLIELGAIETAVAAPGHRVFDVLAEGRPLFPAVDLYALAGDFNWVNLSGTVGVYDGWLDLEFVAKDGSLPPRLAKLRIWSLTTDRSPPREAVVPAIANVVSLGGPECNVLRWTTSKARGFTAYEVLRAATPTGEFRRVDARPVLTSHYVDYDVQPGDTYHYRVVVTTTEGRSVPSKTVSATVLSRAECDLPIYDLQVETERLQRLGGVDADSFVEARLDHGGQGYRVGLRYDRSARRWQAKKSFNVRIDPRRSQLFRGRRQFYLSAEAGDPTALRELLSAAAAKHLELASPQIRPVLLFLNGRFHGLYFDREKIGRRFRARAQLESKSGLLTRPRAGDEFRPDWKPYGSRVGQTGRRLDWVWFVHELNRVGAGELERFLSKRLELPRYVDRSALAVLSGVGVPSMSRRYFLEDTRTRRWEWFLQEHRGGTWGIGEFEWPSPGSTPESVASALRRNTLGELGGASASWSVLHSRFWGQRELRSQFLARIGELARSELSPSVFDGLVDAAEEQVGRWRSIDPWLWLPLADEEHDFAGAVKAWYRHQVEVLTQTVVDETRRSPATVTLSEILLRPERGKARIELRNRSDEAMDLTGYFLTHDPQRPRLHSLAGLSIPARGYGHVVVEASDTLQAAPGGGRLFLVSAPQVTPESAVASENIMPPRVVDSVFYGHQTLGVAYGRHPDSGAWGFRTPRSTAEKNAAQELRPPPYTYRSGVEALRSGDFVLWVTPFVLHTEFEQRPERAEFRWRRGSSAFAGRDMSWSAEQARFQTVVSRDSARSRVEYYFVFTSPDGVEQVYPLVAPELTLSLAPAPPLVINEILPVPNYGAGQREFIEVYNPTNRSVDLSGMFLTDQRRQTTKWRVPEGTIIAPRGCHLFYADGEDRGDHTSFRLSNSGEYVALHAPWEEGNLLVDRLNYHALAEGESWGRVPGGSKELRAWKIPTPGQSNTAPPPSGESLKNDTPANR